MGVSGCGKTTVAQWLARQLHCAFAEGDAFHPEENVAKMRSGTPLSDDDRRGWLQALAAHMSAAQIAGESLVLSCSALKRAYRDLLRSAAPNLHLVYLCADFDTIAQRVANRPGHYMPASLLQSQFATLEPPTEDENPLVLDTTQPLEKQLPLIGVRFQLPPSEISA